MSIRYDPRLVMRSETALAEVNHWDTYHRLWARLRPPLRPDADVAAAVRQAIQGHDQRVLMLGVTPELAGIGDDLTAVDHNQNMIDHLWPKELAARRAVHADWLELPFPRGHFSAVIGDGSLSNLHYPAGYRQLYSELTRVVRPGGRFAARAFVRPDQNLSPQRLCADALAGRAGSFHAFKWRLAMALVAQHANANMGVAHILAAFNEYLPDRAGLIGAAGWSADDFATIDIYAGSSVSYSFPDRNEYLSSFADTFTDVRWQSAGRYELCECCPLLTMEIRSP
jgi:SAM-dependent methyltransferase